MRNLNFRHLLYFWTVAKQGHLTRAAAELRVSQSALSTQIRQLEAYLGRPLFERTARSLQLTEFGAVVLDYADSIFGLAQEFMATVRGGLDQRVQQLCVGVVATLSRNFTENLLRPLFTRAEVRLTLQSGSLEEMLERLSVHNLDVVLSNTPVVPNASRPWRCLLLARQAVCMIGPRRASRHRFRLPEDAVGQRFVLPGPSSDVRTAYSPPRTAAARRTATGSLGAIVKTASELESRRRCNETAPVHHRRASQRGTYPQCARASGIQ